MENMWSFGLFEGQFWAAMRDTKFLVAHFSDGSTM